MVYIMHCMHVYHILDAMSKVPGGRSSLCMRLHFQLSWLCTSRPGFTTGIDGWSITDPSNRDINTYVMQHCNIIHMVIFDNITFPWNGP